MTDLAAKLDEFLDSLRERLVLERDRNDEIGDEVSRTLALWPKDGAGGAKPEPHALPATSHLPRALDLAQGEPTERVAASLRALSPFLKWTYGYPPHPLYPDLPSRVAFTQIVGFDDLFRSETLLIGLTLVAPGTLYPAHFHPAIELYLPVGGAGLWSQGGGEPALRRPGDIILHPENVPHATEAQSDPVLAIYTWRGDLWTKPVFA